jgi:hypothetical protein
MEEWNDGMLTRLSFPTVLKPFFHHPIIPVVGGVNEVPETITPRLRHEQNLGILNIFFG